MRHRKLLLLLLLLEHLRVEVLKCMGIRVSGTRRHSSHQGSSIDLAARTRDAAHVGHMLGHARLRTRLARIMSHALRHRMASRHSRMLLHPRMETRSHRLHHV